MHRRILAWLFDYSSEFIQVVVDVAAKRLQSAGRRAWEGTT
jgi:hypothetical protein